MKTGRKKENNRRKERKRRPGKERGESPKIKISTINKTRQCPTRQEWGTQSKTQERMKVIKYSGVYSSVIGSKLDLTNVLGVQLVFASCCMWGWDWSPMEFSIAQLVVPGCSPHPSSFLVLQITLLCKGMCAPVNCVPAVLCLGEPAASYSYCCFGLFSITNPTCPLCIPNRGPPNGLWPLRRQWREHKPFSDTLPATCIDSGSMT